MKTLPPENKLRMEKGIILCNYLYRVSILELIYMWILVRVDFNNKINRDKRKDWYC